MKKIINSAQIATNAPEVDVGNEQAQVTYHTVMAHIDEVNSNGYNLQGDVIEFTREKYPLLYQHNDQDVGSMIGWVIPFFNEKDGTYEADFGFYESAGSIPQGVSDGVFKEVSVSYYVDEGEFTDDFVLNISKATFAELSIVSVGLIQPPQLLKMD